MGQTITAPISFSSANTLNGVYKDSVPVEITPELAKALELMKSVGTSNALHRGYPDPWDDGYEKLASLEFLPEYALVEATDVATGITYYANETSVWSDADLD